MRIFNIRKEVLKSLKQRESEFMGWEIQTEFDTFEFGDDKDYLEDYLVYRLVNHENKKAYHVHHQMEEDGEHHVWWNNFDEIDRCFGDEIVKNILVDFMTSLMNREETEKNK